MAADTCTLREATIVCSCLREHSIPVMPAAAAMLKIAEMEYNGVNSLLLRTLIEKKYALVSSFFHQKVIYDKSLVSSRFE